MSTFFDDENPSAPTPTSTAPDPKVIAQEAAKEAAAAAKASAQLATAKLKSGAVAAKRAATAVDWKTVGIISGGLTVLAIVIAISGVFWITMHDRKPESPAPATTAVPATAPTPAPAKVEAPVAVVLPGPAPAPAPPVVTPVVLPGPAPAASEPPSSSAALPTLATTIAQVIAGTVELPSSSGTREEVTKAYLTIQSSHDPAALKKAHEVVLRAYGAVVLAQSPAAADRLTDALAAQRKEYDKDEASAEATAKAEAKAAARKKEAEVAASKPAPKPAPAVAAVPAAPRTCKLNGIVYSQDHHRALEGASVEISGAFPKQTLRTDSQGQWASGSLPPDATAHLTLSADKHIAGEADVSTCDPAREVATLETCNVFSCVARKALRRPGA